MPVVVVTDSTACLPARVVAERGIVVVPLQVVIGAQVYDEVLEEGATERRHPGDGGRGAAEFRPVSTSRPTPSALLEVYERAAAEGATEIVSVHLSGEMSGTFESAQLAAKDAPIPVHPVDSRQVGVATGYAALSAADVLAAGGSALEAVEAARERAARATSLFYVDTLEYLRRGGRIGAAAALFGGALAVKPLLQIADGKVANLEKVRTVEQGPQPAGGAGPRGGGRRSRSTCASPTWPAPTAPSSWPSGWPTSWPTTSAVARSGAPSSAPCSAPTSGPAWSRSASRPRPLTRLIHRSARSRWRGPSRLPSVAGMAEPSEEAGRPRGGRGPAAGAAGRRAGRRSAAAPSAATDESHAHAGPARPRAEPAPEVAARRAVPVPGRHAARGPADRSAPAQLAVVAVAGAGRRSPVTAWWVLGGGPPEVVAPPRPRPAGDLVERRPSGPVAVGVAERRTAAR